MKILLIPRVALSIDYTLNLNLGGVEQYIATLTAQLLKDGHSVTTFGTKLTKIPNNSNFNITIIDKYGIFDKVSDENVIRATDKDIITWISKLNLDEFDVILNHHNNSVSLFNILYSKAKDKTLTYFHGLYEQYNKRTQSWLHNHKDFKLAVNSATNQDSFMEVGINPYLIPLHIINEVDKLGFTPFNDNKLNIKNVIGVERLSGEKNVTLLKHLAFYDREHKYYLYDAQRTDKKTIIEKWNDVNFEVLDPISHKDYFSLLDKGNDILCNRAFYESFGMSAAESLMMGRPIISIGFKYNNTKQIVKETSTIELYSSDDCICYDSGAVIKPAIGITKMSEEIRKCINLLNEYYSGDTLLRTRLSNQAKDNYSISTHHINSYFNIILK